MKYHICTAEIVSDPNDIAAMDAEIGPECYTNAIPVDDVLDTVLAMYSASSGQYLTVYMTVMCEWRGQN